MIVEKYKDLVEDEFVDIPGWEGYYRINKKGEIASLPRLVMRKEGYRQPRKGKKMKSNLGKLGYYAIELQRDKSRKRYLIHRLIAMTFIENLNNLPCINHINGVKTDNSINNLEWCTQGDNIRHAFRTGLQFANKGEAHTFFGKTGEQSHNSKIILNTQTGIYYFGSKEASNTIGKTREWLSKRLSGEVSNRTPFKHV